VFPLVAFPLIVIKPGVDVDEVEVFEPLFGVRLQADEVEAIYRSVAGSGKRAA